MNVSFTFKLSNPFESSEKQEPKNNSSVTIASSVAAAALLLVAGGAMLSWLRFGRKRSFAFDGTGSKENGCRKLAPVTKEGWDSEGHHFLVDPDEETVTFAGDTASVMERESHILAFVEQTDKMSCGSKHDRSSESRWSFERHACSNDPDEGLIGFEHNNVAIDDYLVAGSQEACTCRDDDKCEKDDDLKQQLPGQFREGSNEPAVVDQIPRSVRDLIKLFSPPGEFT